MMKIKILLLLLLFTHKIQANEISSEQLKEMFKKSCSQSIDNSVSINSTNINNCNLKYVNEFPKSKELEINQLKKEIAQQKLMVQRLEKKSASIHKNYQKTNLLKDELIQIKDESKQESNKLKTLKFQLNQLDEKHLYFQKIIQNFKNEQNELTRTDKIFMDNLDEKYNMNLKEINSIKIQLLEIKETLNKQKKEIGAIKRILNTQINKIEENTNNLSIYKETLSKQETKIEKVENETSELKILFSKYIFNINNDFVGTYGQRGKDNHYMFGLEYEGYNAKKQSSIFVDLSYEELIKEYTYSTLYGLDDIQIENKKSMYGMEMGYKKFHYIIYNNWRWYNGISLGLAKVKNDSLTLTGKLSLGIEYNHEISEIKNNKFYIEGGYRYLNYIKSVESEFNSVGSGQSSKNGKSFDTSYISIKYLWRL